MIYVISETPTDKNDIVIFTMLDMAVTFETGSCGAFFRMDKDNLCFRKTAYMCGGLENPSDIAVAEFCKTAKKD